MIKPLVWKPDCLLLQLRKPYSPPHREPITKRVRAMTIAVGFQCKDGFVFAADRQMSHGTAADFGSFSHYEEKVFGIDSVSFHAMLCGAGGHGNLIRSFAEAFFANLSAGENEETSTYLSLYQTCAILETTLNDFATKINQRGGVRLRPTFVNHVLFPTAVGLVFEPKDAVVVAH